VHLALDDSMTKDVLDNLNRLVVSLLMFNSYDLYDYYEQN